MEAIRNLHGSCYGSFKIMTAITTGLLVLLFSNSICVANDQDNKGFEKGTLNDKIINDMLIKRLGTILEIEIKKQILSDLEMKYSYSFQTIIKDSLEGLSTLSGKQLTDRLLADYIVLYLTLRRYSELKKEDLIVTTQKSMDDAALYDYDKEMMDIAFREVLIWLSDPSKGPGANTLFKNELRWLRFNFGVNNSDYEKGFSEYLNKQEIQLRGILADGSRHFKQSTFMAELLQKHPENDEQCFKDLLNIIFLDIRENGFPQIPGHAPYKSPEPAIKIKINDADVPAGKKIVASYSDIYINSFESLLSYVTFDSNFKPSFNINSFTEKNYDELIDKLNYGGDKWYSRIGLYAGVGMSVGRFLKKEAFSTGRPFPSDSYSNTVRFYHDKLGVKWKFGLNQDTKTEYHVIGYAGGLLFRPKLANEDKIERFDTMLQDHSFFGIETGLFWRRLLEVNVGLQAHYDRTLLRGEPTYFAGINVSIPLVDYIKEIARLGR